MRVLRFLAAVGIALALAGAAQAKTTISFYSHGWGVASLFVYFPHAFVVIRRDQPDPAGSAPPPAPRDPAAGRAPFRRPTDSRRRAKDRKP